MRSVVKLRGVVKVVVGHLLGLGGLAAHLPQPLPLPLNPNPYGTFSASAVWRRASALAIFCAILAAASSSAFFSCSRKLGFAFDWKPRG